MLFLHAHRETTRFFEVLLRFLTTDMSNRTLLGLLTAALLVSVGSYFEGLSRS